MFFKQNQSFKLIFVRVHIVIPLRSVIQYQYVFINNVPNNKHFMTEF